MAITGTAHEYPIKRYEPVQEDAVLTLLRLTVGETLASRKTAEFWQWKHLHNPFGTSYSICAWNNDEGTLIGLRALMRWSFVDPHGHVHSAARPVDTATHPDYQKRGIFSALTRFAVRELTEEGTVFIFNTPNRNSLPGYLKMGWRPVARWPLYVRPVRLVRLGKRLVAPPRGKRPHPRSVGGFTGGLMPWVDFRDQYGTSLEALVHENERLRNKVGYRTPRSVAYLDWRYGTHPEIEYAVHPMLDEKGLAGITVMRRVPGIGGLRALLVTEVFLREPTVGQTARLLRSLIRITDSDYLVAHFSRGTLEQRALRRVGFVRAPRRAYTFVARALNPVRVDPTLAASWDLTLGELEIF